MTRLSPRIVSLTATTFVLPGLIVKTRLPNPTSMSVPLQPASAPHRTLVGAVPVDVTLTDPDRIESFAFGGPRSMTPTGRDRSLVEPLPSWPTPPAPQHLAAPDFITAQLCTPDVATAATPLRRPETSTGSALSLVVPLPSCPWSLSPQHLTAPVLPSAQALPAPVDIDLIPLSPGTSAAVVVAFQHFTPPSVMSAHRDV